MRESSRWPATWFDWAERVCFLGFSFDPLNVRRLGLADVIRTKVAKGQALPVFASVYGLTAAEVGAAARGVCDGERSIRATGNGRISKLFVSSGSSCRSSESMLQEVSQ